MLTFLTIMVTALMVFLLTVSCMVYLAVRYLKNSPLPLTHSAAFSEAERRVDQLFAEARARMSRRMDGQ